MKNQGNEMGDQKVSARTGHFLILSRGKLYRYFW